MLLLAFAFLAGLFTVLSPCVLPVLPAILSAGTMKGRLRPFAIILGLILSFTFFTLALTAIVRSTGISPNYLRYMAIAIVFLFGLVMLFPGLSDRFAKATSSIADSGQTLQSKSSKEGFFGGLLFGVALGLLWTPCAGPILAAITTLVATQSINFYVFSVTLAYSIGAGIPLFLIAYGGSKIIQSSKFLSRHSESIRQFFGLLMILTAVAIALHWDMILQQKISDIMPITLIEDHPVVKKELEQLRSAPNKYANIDSGKLQNYGPAPEITGITEWINSNPLKLADLKNKVVLIDFWTYSCINCLRTLPYIKKWDEAYRDKGLVIIGVHTPEFEFEKDPTNVKDAVHRLGIKYPVAMDNLYGTWTAYSNLYWPAHYLIDQHGNIRQVHFGEGGYIETENAIRELLGMQALKMEEPVRSTNPLSPETYLGYERGDHYSKEIILKRDQTNDYHYSEELKLNQVGLKGSWKVEGQRITSESDDSYIELKYLAKQVYLVLGGKSDQPVSVSLDGKPAGSITIDADRKYDIVTAPYGLHILSLKVPKGVSAYAFTFGDDP